MPGGCQSGARQAAGHQDDTRPDHLTDGFGVYDGVGGNVVGAPRVADDSEPVCLGDVIGVQRLEPQACRPGDDRQPARADQCVGQ